MAESVVNTEPDNVEAANDQERLETASSDQQQDAPINDDDEDGDDEDDDDEEEENVASDLPFPLFPSKAFYVFDQTRAPRRWCLQLITSPYPFCQLFSLVDIRMHSVQYTCICIPNYHLFRISIWLMKNSPSYKDLRYLRLLLLCLSCVKHKRRVRP